jgi:hypothetical protein
MKLLFTSTDRTAVGLLQSALDGAGIVCELRNDAMQANFPGAAFYPELWVVDDNDYPQAAELRDAFQASTPVPGRFHGLAPAAVSRWRHSSCLVGSVEQTEMAPPNSSAIIHSAKHHL